MLYDTLVEPDETTPLREWFREESLETTAETAEFPGDHHVHLEPLSVMRPEPPTKV